MKAIWTILSTLAVANLLALVAFFGWLKATDRLDVDRLRMVRQTLTETIAAQKARVQAGEAEAKSVAATAAEEAKKAQTPHSALERITAADDADEARRERVERLRREVEDLQRTLSRGREELEAGWSKLDAEKKAFQEMRTRIAALEGSAQFEKALKLYESLKPQQAQGMLQKLIDLGETDQAVAYLNAMQTRTASKVLAEFKDPALAADLLERLRTRGLEARGKSPGTGATPAETLRTDAGATAQPATPNAAGASGGK